MQWPRWTRSLFGKEPDPIVRARFHAHCAKSYIESALRALDYDVALFRIDGEASANWSLRKAIKLLEQIEEGQD